MNMVLKFLQKYKNPLQNQNPKFSQTRPFVYATTTDIPYFMCNIGRFMHPMRRLVNKGSKNFPERIRGSILET